MYLGCFCFVLFDFVVRVVFDSSNFTNFLAKIVVGPRATVPCAPSPK